MKTLNTFQNILACLLVLLLVGAPKRAAHGSVPIAVMEVIKAGVKKVIKAVDLKIQRLQNQTVWLQNAQKIMENTLSKLKLDEISDWTGRQRTLYEDYFVELSEAKSLIRYYRRVRDLSAKQMQLVSEYQRAWNLFRVDKRFTAEERNYMSKVYAGILTQSTKNIDHILFLLNSFTTQMSDAKRLDMIHAAAGQVDANYDDLRLFNRQNSLLSLQRAKEQNDIEWIRKLYGLF